MTFELSTRDAVDWLRDLATESVDLVITEPAYESLEKHRAVGTTTRLKHSKASSNDWFNIFPNARFGELFAEVYRVLKPDTHFYLLCDSETMFVAKPEARRWSSKLSDRFISPCFEVGGCVISTSFWNLFVRSSLFQLKRVLLWVSSLQ